jgi:hypothetical protein
VFGEKNVANVVASGHMQKHIVARGNKINPYP